MGFQHHEGDDVILTFEREGADEVIDMSAVVFKITRTGGEKTSNSAQTFGRRGFSYRGGRQAFKVLIDVKIYNALPHMIALGGTTYANGSEIRPTDIDYRWRIILWATKPSNMAINGTTAVPKKVGAIGREIWKDCKAVSFTEDFSRDEYWKGTIEFIMDVTDEDGYTNYFFQMTTQQGTTALNVLNSTAHKGALTWNTTTPAFTGSYRT